jgi:hypothetical protein
MEGGQEVKMVDPDASRGIEQISIGKNKGLKITTTEEKTVELAVINKPEVLGKRYLVKGWIKYSGVEGDGYMELWSHFGEQAFFSRTLGDGKGPMQKLTGDSDWRVFILPFDMEEGMKPDKLVVNLVLKGKGEVILSELRFVSFPASDPKAQSGWWSPRDAGWIGGGIGCLGAVFGTAAAILARRSTQGSILLAKIALTIGFLSLVGAGVAAAMSQPWHVWYPPALLGVILVLVFGFRLPAIRRASVEGELRRMRAVDA